MREGLPLVSLSGLFLGFGAVVGLSLLAFPSTADLPSVAHPPDPGGLLRDLDRRRPGGETRIFVLGASLTAGYPYKPIHQASYGTLLGKGLQAVFEDHEIVSRAWAKPALDSAKLELMTRAILDWDPSLLCVALGSNEFANRIFSGRTILGEGPLGPLSEGLGRSRILFHLLEREGRGEADPAEAQAFEARIQGLIARGEPGRPALSGIPVSDRDQAVLLARLRRAMRGMSRAARARGVPLVFLVACYGLGGFWPWGTSEGGLDPQVDALVREARRNPDPALLPRIEAQLEGKPRRADLHFLRALLLRKAGKAVEARRAFERARDLDPVPMHLTGRILAAIQAEAAALGRPCLVLDKALAEKAPDGIPGPAFYLDYGHLSDRGHLHLAVWLARKLAGLGLLPPLPRGFEERFREAAARHLDRVLDPVYRRQASALMANADGSFAMLFGNFREALPYLMTAFAEALPVSQKEVSIQLTTCILKLSGRREEVLALPQEERTRRFHQLYERYFEALSEGRFPSLVEGLLRGEPLWKY